MNMRKEKGKMTYPDRIAKRKEKAENALSLLEKLAPSHRRRDGELASWGNN
jgi:hypothetical protein